MSLLSSAHNLCDFLTSIIFSLTDLYPLFFCFTNNTITTTILSPLLSLYYFIQKIMLLFLLRFLLFCPTATVAACLDRCQDPLSLSMKVKEEEAVIAAAFSCFRLLLRTVLLVPSLPHMLSHAFTCSLCSSFIACPFPLPPPPPPLLLPAPHSPAFTLLPRYSFSVTQTDKYTVFQILQPYTFIGETCESEKLLTSAMATSPPWAETILKKANAFFVL